MPSLEDNRVSADFTKRPDILKLILEEAEREDRSKSWIVVNACVEYFQRRKQEAELFIQKQPGGKTAETLVFETPTPDQLAAERAAKIRASHGQEKS